MLNDMLKLGVGFKVVDFCIRGGGFGDVKDWLVNGMLCVKSNFLLYVLLFWSLIGFIDVFIDLVNIMNGYCVV